MVDELEEASSNTERSEDEHDIQHSESEEETPQLHHALNNLHAALGPQAQTHPPHFRIPRPAMPTPTHSGLSWRAQLHAPPAGAAAVLRAVPERTPARRRLARRASGAAAGGGRAHKPRGQGGLRRGRS